MKARWAIAAMFFMNGFVTGSWAPHIPVFMARLGIGEFTLGLLILAFGLGALITMPLAGVLMAAGGSQKVLRAFAVATVFGLPLVVLAPTVPLAALALLAFGGVVGGMDVAMNANAVAVERHLARAIMSASHGFWSLGGFAGGAAGGLAIARFGALAHAGAVAVIAALILAIAWRFLFAEAKPVAQEGRTFALPKTASIYLIGLVALFSMVPEGAVLDWAALYLRQELGADLATSGFAFAAFSGTMALMRFLGDGVRGRFGAVATLRVSSLIAAMGMLAAALAPSPALAILAFGLTGLGVANIIPIVFSAAGNQPGLSPGTGMSVATTMGYTGILAAPSVIGFVASHTGFATIFATLSGLLLLVCLWGRLMHRAEFASDEPRSGPSMPG